MLYLDVHDGGRRVDELIKSPRINCHCTPVLSQARCTTKMCRRSLSTVGPLHDILQPPGHRPPRSKECSVEPQPSMQSTTFVGRYNGFMTRGGSATEKSPYTCTITPTRLNYSPLTTCRPTYHRPSTPLLPKVLSLALDTWIYQKRY